MGNNSIFDEVGLGASDLGFAQDPDKVRDDQQRQMRRQESEAKKAKAEEERQATIKRENNRMENARVGRASTIVTGANGVDDEDLKISRRTLIGN